MPEFLIRNVPVHFPFEPYDVQKTYMDRVIDCLQTGAHGMLESPTGTGKTLSLLCSSLAWLTHKKALQQAQTHLNLGAADEQGPYGELKTSLNNAVGSMEGKGWARTRIIYASRTHSQLTQAIAELKRTNYTHMQTAVIGSREQLCVHEAVCQEHDASVKITMCQTLVKERKCTYHLNVERKRDHPDFVEAGVMDIEDLIKVSTKQRVCPYYMARELKDNADIIFMPYNYILDQKTRKQQDINLTNAVVILDEGHNVEKICEDSASVSLSSTDVAICLSEVTHVMKAFSDDSYMESFNMGTEGKDFTAEELMSVKSMLLELETAIDSIELTDKQNTEVTFTGEYIFEILGKASLSNSSFCKYFLVIDKIVQYLGTVSQNSPFQRNGSGLDRFLNFLTVVFSFENTTFDDHIKDVRECYKVFVTFEKQKQGRSRQDSFMAPVESKSKPGGKVVNFWCFNPGFGMRNLLKLGIHSIIITSGTLSPLPPLISELGIPINVTLENGHVISPDQVFVGVVSRGPDGVSLNSSFRNRGDSQYLSSLGRTIINFCRLIPEGLLVFFPSYTMLNSCKESWQESGIWTQISAIKEIFVEPQGKREFNEVMTGYYKTIATPGSKGACFLAVCRGKVSEGLDFADHNGRAVVLTGLPYPPFYDPRVDMKKQYLDRNKKKVTGRQWYSLEATRAVNQAVGRVIRHRNDYGAVLFCDERFAEPATKNQFSAWLRPFVKTYPQFGMITRELCQFFKHAKIKLPSEGGKPVSNAWSARSTDSPNSQAVSASFDTRSRLLIEEKRLRSQKGNFSWNTSQQLGSSLSASYSQVNVSSQSFKPENMFGALEKSTTAIDFNSVGTSDENTSTSFGCVPKVEHESDLDPEVFQVSKRRKVRVMGVPLNFENNTSEQVSSSSASSTKEQMKVYLVQVKNSLTPPEMKLLKETITNYSKCSNFSELVQNLDSVFKRSDQMDLFKGFERYIRGVHKDKFAEYCSKKFNA